MKIALALHDYDAHGGGAERWTDRHARYLLAAGHEVHLLSRRFRGAPANAVCTTIPEGPGGRLSFGAQVEKVLQSRSFDAVHDMGDGWACDVFLPHHGTRTGGFERNSALARPHARSVRRLANEWLPRYRQFRDLESRQYSGDKIFIALSEMVRADMQRYNKVPAERIRVVYNGVDVDRFHPATARLDRERRTKLRNEWGLAGRTVFLLVAHNFRLKGLDAALRAIGRLNAEGKPVGLVVAGAGRAAPYQAKARRLGCENVVRFVGDQRDPLPCYHAADAYVQPTYYDPCSLVVLEALACGLPVLTSRYNGAGELIEPGRQGFILSDPGDDDGLAHQMRTLLDADVRGAMSTAARELAERNTLAKNSESLVQLYLQVQRTRRAA
jgi:UDP-glucose:(heptosyl)LPS alpha-1,3-glucosyltransferase